MAGENGPLFVSPLSLNKRRSYADIQPWLVVRNLEVQLHYTSPGRMKIMRKLINGFAITDFLIIVAICLIAIGIVGPTVSKHLNKSNARPSATVAVHPSE